jgi:hypothetical protein
MQPQNQAQQKQLQMVISDDDQETKAANFATVSSNPVEFVFDFFHVFAPSNTAKLQTRISLSLIIAKEFLKILAENISIFESKNGEIRKPSEPLPRIGFQPPTGN